MKDLVECIFVAAEIDIEELQTNKKMHEFPTERFTNLLEPQNLSIEASEQHTIWQSEKLQNVRSDWVAVKTKGSKPTNRCSLKPKKYPLSGKFYAA